MNQIRPLSESQLKRSSFGFRDGDRGSHSSRTIMLTELKSLFDQVGTEADRETYRFAILENNALGKQTQSTRKSSAQKLSELYGLDPKLTVFRLLRFFWATDETAQPCLALLCAAARDPILRMTISLILQTSIGQRLNKSEIEAAIAESAPGRFSPKTLGSIARNVSSSWTQSGHLTGKKVKTRHQPTVTVATVAFALVLGYLEGARGQLLFETSWIKLLGLPNSEVMAFAIEASRRGWLDYRGVGSLIEIRFSALLTPEERSLLL